MNINIYLIIYGKNDFLQEDMKKILKKCRVLVKKLEKKFCPSYIKTTIKQSFLIKK